MKLFISSLVVIFVMSSIAFADNCTKSCSGTCIDAALEVRRSANDLLETCGSNPDEMNRAETVAECAASFGTKEKRSQCFKEAKSASIVKACVESYGIAERGFVCATQAKSARKVTECAASFGNGQRALDCSIGSN